MPAKAKALLSSASDERLDGETGARLDLGVLSDHVGYFLRRLQVLIFQEFIAAVDIRPAQYSVLVLIASNPGRSQAAIGRALNIERAALARLLHGFERRQWIERRPSAADARSHALYLTRAGQAAFVRINAQAMAHERRMARMLGDRRRRALLELLKDFG